ncbi:MAG: long-chain acyl-CoA synthetase, partial [Acidimicrobiaceae bacterium]|nr:long-chain acyl-CoA synthetase [Acidimicrobiaceae bacterium]
MGADLVSRWAGGHATATALVEGDDRVTYGELRDRVLRTAAGLHAAGLGPGVRIAVAAACTVDGVVGYLGVQAAGLLPVMVSPRSPLAEQQRRFDELDPALVVLGAGTRPELPDGLRVVRPAGSSAGDAEVVAAEPAGAARVGDHDPAVVLYTSGMAGIPKPVVLTFGNVAATSDGIIAGPGAGLDSSTIAFAGLPLAHVFGLNSIVGTVLRAGGKLILHDGFDPEEVSDLVARHRVTALSGVPLMWKALAEVGNRAMFATISRATYAAAGAPPAVAASVAESLGLALAGGFGLTETAGTICHDDPTHPHAGTVGRPLGATELRIVDDGGDALSGDYGEIWLRGPSVARTYLDGSPVDLTDDGWFRTGDVGVLDDDGRLAIVDRKKDVINISGFNVSPAEVEAALSAHHAVANAVVVGEVDNDREVV